MGFSTRRLYVPVLAALVLLAPLATAQDASPEPERLFTYGEDRDAPVNDVAISAGGALAAAVFGDPGATGDGEGSVCPWNLKKSPRSADPAWVECGEPGGDDILGTDVGLEVVDVHERGTSSPHIAVGNLGDNAENEIYVYSLSAGSGSDSLATYEDGNRPEGAVQDLFFLDRDSILAWHGGALSLLKHDRGTTYEEPSDGRWTPSEGTIEDVAVAGNGRVLVSTSVGSQTGDQEIQLRLLEDDGGSLVEASETETLQDKGLGNVLAVDGDADRLAVGTDDEWVYYYGIEEDTANDTHVFSDTPYSVQVGAPVTAIGMGADGDHFAAGDGDAELTVFNHTVDEKEGPRASPKGTVETAGQVDEVDFAQGGQQIYATGGGLYAFHISQFEEDEVSPLWTVTRLASTDFADSGQRFIGHSGSTVSAHQHAYNADVTLEGPDAIRPGDTTSIDVEVTNLGSLRDTFTLDTEDVPNTWTVDLNRTEVALLPGETATATLNLTPDARQDPGDVTFTLTATSDASPNNRVAGEASHTVNVQEVAAAGVSVGQDRLEVDQGGTASFSADVANVGNTDATITLSVAQEASWSVRIDGEAGNNADVELSPGEDQLLSIELDVPGGARKGSTNVVTLTAQPDGGGASEEATVELIVNPSYAAALSVPTEPIDVEPDERATFDVTVQNTGNTEETYTLRTHSNASNPEHLWSVSLEGTSVTVAPDGSRTLEVTVEVPRGAELGESADVTFVARSTTTGEKVDEAAVTLQVPEDSDDTPLPVLLVPASLGAAALVRRDR